MYTASRRPPSPPPLYTLMNDALSWEAAEQACLGAGLLLATVKSAEENALLITAAAGNSVWIGGTDKDDEDKWKWSPSGTELSYTNWHPGEPNNVQGNEHCLVVIGRPGQSNNGKWNDGLCSSKLKYVCQMPKYTLMNDALSWEAAEQACLGAGLLLATVKSAEENALLITAAAGNSVWIGGTDKDDEDKWKWSPSGTELSYTNWHPGEPNNVQGNEHCLVVIGRPGQSHNGKWNDGLCSSKLKYVCQII